MKNKKNTIMLVVIIISLVILTWNKSYSYEMNDNIVEEKEIERKEFGIYLENTQGSEKQESDYTETTIFPKQGYLLNEDKTECYEYGTNTKVTNAVTQSLTKGVIDGSIIVTSTKSMYCNIYFDKDDNKPTIKTFELTGNTDNGTTLSDNKKYTHTTKVNYSLTWNDEDVAQICVKENGNCAETDWIQITGASKSGTINITTGDTGKTINAFVKDKANNISEAQIKSIILDQTDPTITLNEGDIKTTENSIVVNVEVSDANGISNVTCKAEGNSTIVDGEYSDTDKTCTFNELTAETEYTITGEVEDNSGRRGTSEVIKIKTPSAWKCTEGNLVNDSSKGTSSGGYICVKNATYQSYKCCETKCDKSQTWTVTIPDPDWCRVEANNDKCKISSCVSEGDGHWSYTQYKPYEECSTCYRYVCDSGWSSYNNSQCYKAATKG